MPLQRFRDPEEARRALWTDKNDPTLAARIRRLWTFARRLAPGVAPRGLRMFRTLEEAGRERDQWVEQRARALRRERTN
jgi:hypothetical protein